MHAGPIVTEQRLGHERDSLAVSPGYIFNDVLLHHHLVGHGRQRVIPKVDLRLPCRRDLMMVFLDHDTHLLHLIDHLTTYVLLCINGWNREIDFLMTTVFVMVVALFSGITG